MKTYNLLWILLLSVSAIANDNTEIINREISQLDKEVEKRKVQISDWGVIRNLISPAQIKLSDAKYNSNGVSENLAKLKEIAEGINEKGESDIDRAEVESEVYSAIRTIVREYGRRLSINLDPSNLFEVANLLTPSQTQLAIQAFSGGSDAPQMKVYTVVPNIRFLSSRLMELPKLNGTNLFSVVDSKYTYSTQYLDYLSSLVSEDQFELDKSSLSEYYSKKIGFIDGKISSLNTEVENYQSQINRLIQNKTNKESKKQEIDQILITVALPALGVLMILLMLIPRFYRSEELHLTIFTSGVLLELFTVFLLTSTILILGLGDKIKSEVLGTLLGGISGYVLGRTMSVGNKNESNKTNPAER